MLFIRKGLVSKIFQIATGIAMLGMMACGSGGQQRGGGPPPGEQNYPVFTVATQNATLSQDYPVTIQGRQNIDIRPKIDGYVDEIFIDEGAVVKKGQLLFTIRNPQYAQDVNNAEAALYSTKADLGSAQLAVTKAKALVEKDIISRYELESAEYTLQARKAALLQAEANLANARTNKAYTRITSPVDGIAGSLPFKTGSYVSSSSQGPLTTISNTSSVYAYFSLNEKQLLNFSRITGGATMAEKLKHSPLVSLTLSDGTQFPEKGRLETVTGQINTETGASSFRATFANPLGTIRSGSSGTLHIPQEIQNGMLIPQQCTYELQGKRFVYVVGAANEVSSTEIITHDLTAGDYFVVKSGLKPGDKVIYDGSLTLKNGDRIKPVPMKQEEVYKNANQQTGN